jgi:hypothetical protein
VDRGTLARIGTGLVTAAVAMAGFAVATGDHRMKLVDLAGGVFALAAVAGIAIVVVALRPRWSRFGPRIGGWAAALAALGALILVPLRTLEACACASPPVETVPVAPAVAGMPAHDFVALVAIAAPLLLIVAARLTSANRRRPEDPSPDLLGTR